MRHVTIVGGGLAGLVAAITSAERGATVTLYEAGAELGGRARSTRPPFVANDGPHAVYDDGATWRWLNERGLAQPAARLPVAALGRLRVRLGGRRRATVPPGLARLLASRHAAAPVERDFHGWAAERWGDEAAAAAARLLGVVTYVADPGRLSAAFVWERLLRATAPRYPTVRYLRGGWSALVDRLEARARALGVAIETGARVDSLPAPPVIVATALPAARRLLGDPSLAWDSGRAVLLDLGLTRRAGDLFVLADLDEAGFLARYSGADPSLAPPGHSLVQAQLPLAEGEAAAAARARLERLVDLGLPDWRERAVWRRDTLAVGRSGAIDLPGRSWSDRPAIERGDGVFLAGDMVAAPGMLAEVSVASAEAAARAATRPATLRAVAPA